MVVPRRGGIGPGLGLGPGRAVLVAVVVVEGFGQLDGRGVALDGGDAVGSVEREGLLAHLCSAAVGFDCGLLQAGDHVIGGVGDGEVARGGLAGLAGVGLGHGSGATHSVVGVARVVDAVCLVVGEARCRGTGGGLAGSVAVGCVAGEAGAVAVAGEVVGACCAAFGAGVLYAVEAGSVVVAVASAAGGAGGGDHPSDVVVGLGEPEDRHGRVVDGLGIRHRRGLSCQVADPGLGVAAGQCLPDEIARRVVGTGDRVVVAGGVAEVDLGG